jgi:hypothetical protein
VHDLQHAICSLHVLCNVWLHPAAVVQVTSGLLWLETSDEGAPQYLRDVVPERPVRWSTQVVPADLSTAQALIATPLAGALHTWLCNCSYVGMA